MTDLEEIFNKQMELIEKYTPIEMENLRCTDEHPVNLNSRKGQIVIKDFLWRCTEELIEAYESPNQNEYLEELSDVLHFMTELCILSDIEPLYLDNEKSLKGVILKTENKDKESTIFEIIRHLGLAGNELKARPWKKEYPDTVRSKYGTHIILAYKKLIGLFASEGCTDKQIKEIYFDKNSINHKRIKGGY